MAEKILTQNELIERYMNYIKEEYRDDFINDDENEPYIKFNAKEFENFCRYILAKAIQKTIENEGNKNRK